MSCRSVPQYSFAQEEDGHAGAKEVHRSIAQRQRGVRQLPPAGCARVSELSAQHNRGPVASREQSSDEGAVVGS